MNKITLAIVLVCLAGYASWRWFLRHTVLTTIDARQVSGDTVRVTRATSRRLYLGSGHWGYGGGDLRVVLEFQFGSRSVRWQGSEYEEPRVLQVRGQEAYLVSQANPWSLTERAHLNFYAVASTADGTRWIPIELDNFPASLAKCNLSPQGNTWRSAGVEERGALLEDSDEKYVQGLLDRLFASSDAEAK